MPKSVLRALAFFATFWCLSSLSVFAAITGDIRGTVLDPQGRVVSGAMVTIRNVATAVTRNITTDETGEFSALQLDVGTYEVRVEKSGFRTVVLTAGVRSGEVSRVDLTLELGSATETVEVQAGLPILDTSNAQVSDSLSPREVSQLPNLTHDVLAFATLAPGTVPVTKDNPFLGTGSLNVNGQRGRANNITIDNNTAVDISTTGSSGLGTFSMDSVSEFKLITNNFTAEFGRNSGAQIQVITKSGTNAYHGTVYWFNRNAFYNARDFFDTTGKVTPYNNNLWGFEAGGPIRKDRLFVYGHYEGNKIRGLGSTGVATVLTPAQAAAITDPTSKALFAAVGAPTSPTSQLNSPAPNKEDQYSWSLRVDDNFRNGRDQFVARYGANPDTQVTPSLTFVTSQLPNYGASAVSTPRVANTGWTHTFSSALINQARFWYQRSTPNFQPFTTLAKPYAPTIEISGFDNMGVSRILPQGRTQNIFQGGDSFSWAAGKHALKFGANVFRYQENSFFDSAFRGRFQFTSVANFQSGVPSGFIQNVGTSVRGNRATDVFLFAQDELRVSRTLTLNYGLRLESSGGVSEVNNILSNLDRDRFAPLGGGGTGPLGTMDLGGTAFQRNNNWAPRLGLAWNPHNGNLVVRGGYGWAYDYIFLNPITNLRFSAPFVPGITLNAFSGSNSYANLYAGTSQAQSDAIASVGTFPSTLVNFGAISPIQQNLKNPRAAQWNFGLEYQMRWNLALKATYIGVQSKFLEASIPINLIPQALRPAPATSLADETARLTQFTTAFGLENGTSNGSVVNNRLDHRFNGVTQVQSVGSSMYHALQFEAVKQYSHGLSFLGSYTYGHSIDDISDPLSVLINDSANFQDPRDIKSNRGNSQFDIRHRVVLSHLWDIPGTSRFTGIAGRVLGGWSFNGIFSFQTGFPATTFSGSRKGISDVALLGLPSGSERTNGDPTLFHPAPAGSPAAALNAANNPFSQPLLGNFGTTPRNALRLGNITDFDWGLFKTTKLTERYTFQLRWELYNVLNRANFGLLNNTFTSPIFGTYTTTATDSRRMQLGLKVLF
jgi:carboxypeptidase family protein